MVIDKLDYCANLHNLKAIAGNLSFKFIKGDICAADLIAYVLRTEVIDTVMHFAAQTHVDNSFGNSFDFMENNIRGTHVLLETCKNIAKTFVKKEFVLTLNHGSLFLVL